MVGAHNGNVVNNVELRAQFMAEGMTVRSQNDGETCVHAVERYISRGYDFIDAIRLAYGDLQGDYAFVIGRANDDQLYAFKKGSGLVVGIGDGFTCVSSDLPSILPLTRNVIRPQDGEIVTLWADRVEVRSVKDGSLIDRPAETVTESMDAVQKGGYAHFMLKEIHEQPQVARELLHLLDGSPDVAPLVEQMRSARHLYLIGCGTSYHAAWSARSTSPSSPGAPRSPCWRRSSSPSTRPRSVTRTSGSSSASRARPRTCSTPCEAAEARGMTCFGLANVVGSTLTRAARLLPAAVLRLRDQRAGHQDLHQPGRDLPVPGLPPGGAGHGSPGARPGPDGADARGRRPARSRRSPTRSTPGTTCTASATARPTRSRWRAR